MGPILQLGNSSKSVDFFLMKKCPGDVSRAEKKLFVNQVETVAS